jgi:hypothetical protein
MQPTGWEAGEGAELAGSTQHCATMADRRGEDVAHFALPFEADIFFNINQVRMTCSIKILPSLL